MIGYKNLELSEMIEKEKDIMYQGLNLEKRLMVQMEGMNEDGIVKKGRMVNNI